jgi:hypothetical protein
VTPKPLFRRKVRALSCAVLCASFLAPALAAPSTARADDTKPADADIAAELKRRGDEALLAGKPAEALAAYDDAYAKRPDPALLYNKGRAHEALGDYPRALENLEQFEKLATPELRQRVLGLSTLIADFRKKVASLAVICDVEGATIRLRDRTIGTTPLSNVVRVNAGPGTLEVLKEGYFPYKTDVVLPGGGIASFDVKLSSRLTSGLLVVTSPVVGARATVDGKSEGTVPLEVVVGSGPHRIELTRDGYHPASSSVVLAAGERRSVDLPLEATAGVTSKWWFWTAIGVGLAAGVVGVIVLTTEKDAGDGSIAPGRISAGLSF